MTPGSGWGLAEGGAGVGVASATSCAGLLETSMLDDGVRRSVGESVGVETDGEVVMSCSILMVTL